MSAPWNPAQAFRSQEDRDRRWLNDWTSEGPDDPIVYAHPDGVSYVGYVDEGWWQWPAQQHGWRSKRAVNESTARGCEELPLKLADIALRLSGARP